MEQQKTEYKVQATGKRKTAIASFREKTNMTGLMVNNKKFEEYFTQEKHRLIVLSPLKTPSTVQLQGMIKVSGSGLSGQAEAIRHAISKFLKNNYSYNEELIKTLKKNGFLTRDSRKKERKKPGQEGARRNFQSQKR